METTTKMTIYTKLCWLQQNLKAPKDQKNTHSGYMYRTASGILSALKPLCQSADVSILLRDEIVWVGSYHYVKATAGIVDNQTGEAYTTTAYAREDIERKGMCNSQISGTASSYARKYALAALLAIDDSSSDPDTMDNRGYGQQQQGGYAYGSR